MRLLSLILLFQLTGFGVAKAQFTSNSIVKRNLVSNTTVSYSPIGSNTIYSLSSSLGLYNDDNKHDSAPFVGGLAGMLAGTLIGGSVGFEIGKGDRESLTGAFKGALLGAVIGNSLLIPLGVTVSSNNLKRLPLSIGLSSFAGMGIYFLATKENRGAAILAPFSQLAISLSLVKKRR